MYPKSLIGSYIDTIQMTTSFIIAAFAFSALLYIPYLDYLLIMFCNPHGFLAHPCHLSLPELNCCLYSMIPASRPVLPI